MVSRVKEAEYIDELMEYIDIAISDKDTDGDRIIGYIVGILADKGLINNTRANHYYKEARKCLKERRS